MKKQSAVAMDEGEGVKANTSLDNVKSNIEITDNIQTKKEPANDNVSTSKINDYNTNDKANVNNEDKQDLFSNDNDISETNAVSQNGNEGNNINSKTNQSIISQEDQNIATGNENGIANSDEIEYKGGEGKTKAFANMSFDEAMQMAKEYAKKSPIQIPETANIKASTMKNGYEQIKYKWADDVYKYEVRWHTKTPNAPAEQGNTWVIKREIPGSGNKSPQTFIKINNTGTDADWISGYRWYDAIRARRNGNATPGQIEILDKGHWKE